MNNLITKVKYSNAKKNNGGGYLRYVATREGVVTIDNEYNDFPVTAKQKKLIEQLVDDFPEFKEMPEYNSFIEHATIYNAHIFLNQSLDEAIESEDIKEDDGGYYLKYIGERPKVVIQGNCGLWGDRDDYVLDKEVEELNSFDGNYYRYIISLKREDAIRLGYDNINAWKNLTRSKVPLIAETFHIPISKLKWHAAFHDEGDHPHIHMVIRSSDPNVGYHSKKGVRKLKKEFANTIFKNENQKVYIEKDNLRKQIGDVTRQKVDNIINEMVNSNSINILTDKMAALQEDLSYLTGKKSYGYLPHTIKKKVDDILSLISKDENINKLYELYYQQQDILVSRYKKNGNATRYPLQFNKEFKNLKNIIIKCALNNDFSKIYSDSMERSSNNQESKFVVSNDNSVNESEINFESESMIINSVDEIDDSDINYIMEFDDHNYKLAKSYLYDENPDFEKAFKNMTESALVNGNVLALFDLANMYQKGIGCQSNDELSKEYYIESLEGFESVLKNINSNSENKNLYSYIHYRIGKFYYMGKGVEQNDDNAIKYFEKSNNKYANYSLGNIYKKREEYDTAFKYYTNAANQDMPFAHLEIAKLYENNLINDGTDKKIQYLYKKAYNGFINIINKNPSDTLLYRVGRMTYEGTGCTVDEEQAIKFLEQSIKLENKDARIYLSRKYLKSEDQSVVKKGLDLIINLGEENEQAAYLLAKYYINADNYELGKYYIDKSIELNHENDYAKLLFCKTGLKLSDKDIHLFDEWHDLLKELAEKENADALALYGRVLYNGFIDPKNSQQIQDDELGIVYLKKAIDMDSISAKLFVGKTFLRIEDENKITEGISILEQLSEINDYANYYLASYYIYNDELEKGVDYLKKSLNMNSENETAKLLFCKTAIRNISENGEIPEQFHNWYDYLLELVEKNNPEAQNLYGQIMLKGFIDPKEGRKVKDIDKGIVFLKKSIDADNKSSQLFLGRYNIESHHAAQIQEGVGLLKEMSNENARANYYLAKYFFKVGDISLGIKYIEKNIELDDTSDYAKLLYCQNAIKNQGQNIMAFHNWHDYLNDMLNKNFIPAKILYARILLNGINDGQHQIHKNIADGIEMLHMNMNGDKYVQSMFAMAVIKNNYRPYFNESISILEELSENGNDMAQFTLGRIYYFGLKDFVEMDREMGLYYIKMAQANGNQYAAQFLENTACYHGGAVDSSIYLGLNLLRLCGNHIGNQIQTKRDKADHKLKQKELEKKQAHGLKQ